MPNNRDPRLLNTMRNVAASGITDKETLIDTAADVIGGSDQAKKAARAVYEKHFEIFSAN